MKIKPLSFRSKLALSHIFIILFSFGLAAYLLQKNLQGRSFVISLFFALGLAFVLGSLLARGIIRPLNKIINISRRFSRGDFSHKIYVDTKDEIAELALTLNKMAQGLDDKIREIEVKNQHLVTLLESMAEGIIVVDKASRVLSINASGEKILGVSKQDAQGRAFLEVFPNSDIAGIIGYVLGKGKFSSRELSLVFPVRKTFQIDAAPIFEQSRISGCLLVVHDITRIRELEAMRRDFVANVSHELKTPLTSIKGFVETLLDGALEDKENFRHFLQIIQGHTKRLEALVNDLLELSRIESQKVPLEKERVMLKGLADTVVSGFKSQLKKNSIEAANDLSSDLCVLADKRMIEQVFTNLIDNAVKFNRQNGSVRIYDQDSGTQVKIVVEDSGIGIPPKDIPRIFERFYRVDKARSRELGGTGLGLSIVRHIIEAHGGITGVESIEGLGSKFWFTLPKQP